MTKRGTQDSDNLYFDADDDPIGLTGAFAPVKGPQSVDYDEGDDAIGLTQAFGAIPDQDEPNEWDRAGKWNDFDWNASFGDGVDDIVPMQGFGEDVVDQEASDEVASAQPIEVKEYAEPALQPKEDDAQGAVCAVEAVASDAEGQSGQAEESLAQIDAVPASDLTSQEEPLQVSQTVTAASEPVYKAVGADEPPLPGAKASGAASGSRASGSGEKRGRHAAPEPELSPRMRKSQRTRRILVVLVILLVLAAGALGYYMYQTFSNSQQEAAQQTQEQVTSGRDDIADAPTDDAAPSVVQLADVPVLTGLLGKSQDKAIEELGRGAMVTSNREVKEEGSPIKTELTITLTEEPGGSKTGTPTVYFGLGEDGTVRQVGYSASASALGFGTVSFTDAVTAEHVVEKTLAQVGVQVKEGTVKLPDDKKKYTTLDKDGKTVLRERCSFDGATEVNGKACTWSSVLSYDYTAQVYSGNIADTIRIIYVYLTLT